MYFRTSQSGNNKYLQIVVSFRENGKVRQRVLGTLGRLDQLQQSGALEKLLENGAKYCREGAVLEAHRKGQTELESVKRIGAELVFSPLWEQTGIGPILRKLASSNRYGFDLERAVFLTVMHRVFGGGSDRAAERWREDYRLSGTEQLQLHQLYRTMFYLGEVIDESDSPIAGSVRARKDLIEEQMFAMRRDLFTQVDLMFFDTTSIYFEGRGGQHLGKHGNSKDHRPDLPQMVVGMVVDGNGHPICSEMWPGNTTDVTTLIPVVNRLRDRFNVRDICVVADRGMFSDTTLWAFENHDPVIQYIVGARMRRQKEVSEKVLGDPGSWSEVYPERVNTKDPAPLKIKEVVIDSRRYVVCLNEEERRKDAHVREAILEQLKKQLKRGDKGLVGNKGYRRYLKSRRGGSFTIDQKRVEAESRFDGVYVMRSNTDLAAEQVALTYKNLWVVENIFRTTKSILHTRPIYHKWDETIRGHVFCSFLALTLRSELEARMRQAGMQWEWKEVIRGLNALQEVIVVSNGQRFSLRSKLGGHALQAIRGAGVALPNSFVPLD